MPTPDDQWWDAQAGEYVLGTLRDTERDVFERILASDNDVQRKVDYWRQRFAYLDALNEPVAPPAHILPLILDRIGQEGVSGANTSAIDAASTSKRPAPGVTAQNYTQVSEKSHKRRSRASQKAIRTWKTVSAMALAATVALAALLLQNLSKTMPVSDPSLEVVSVVQNEALEALWVLTTQKDTGLLRAVALAPPEIDNTKSYQLWMVKPDDAGVSSVGLLPLNPGETRELLLQIPTEQAQLFAVSLEPSGGSPEAVPTGPVLYTGAITAVTNP